MLERYKWPLYVWFNLHLIRQTHMNGNLHAGFVTTGGIDSPYSYDFYLQSQHAIQGSEWPNPWCQQSLIPSQLHVLRTTSCSRMLSSTTSSFFLIYDACLLICVGNCRRNTRRVWTRLHACPSICATRTRRPQVPFPFQRLSTVSIALAYGFFCS